MKRARTARAAGGMVHIALLRGINVVGRRMVAMSDLRAMLEDLGFENVRTVLQSGNLVFRGGRIAEAALEDLLEKEAARRLGVTTEFVVRTPDEWDAVIARNPFPEEAVRDPGHLLVMFCKQAPGEALTIRGVKREVVRAHGREIYIVYPDGVGESRLKLNARGTARNWNTIRKLAALARA